MSNRLAILCALVALGSALAGVSAQAAGALPSGVTIHDSRLGPVYADRRGFTLYTTPLDNISPGKSSCTDKRVDYGQAADGIKYPLPDLGSRKTCQDKAPPLLAAADFKPFDAWGVAERAPGVRQLTLNGHPLYTSVKDHAPGEVNAGMGLFYLEWKPATAPLTGAPPGVKAVEARSGMLLAAADGRILLVHRNECTGACPTSWDPLSAPAIASAAGGGWATAARDDASRQWTYHGKPVYLAPASMTDSIKTAPSFSGEWTPVVYHAAEALPADIHVARALPGVIFTTREGKTLYAWFCTEQSSDRLSCDDAGDSRVYLGSVCGTPDACAKNWAPYYASAGAQPTRDWTLVPANDPRVAVAPSGSTGARLVWAFRGRPVYTYADDKISGDINGDRAGWFALAYFMVLNAAPSGDY